MSAEPFGRARPVEGATIAQARVPESTVPPMHAAFVDGVQRFAVEGWVGVSPIVRGYTAAAVLERCDGDLRPVEHMEDEFIVASVAALPAGVVEALREVDLSLYDSGPSDRVHPLIDFRRAVGLIEDRRREMERMVAERFRRHHSSTWIVVDGSLGNRLMPIGCRDLGVVRSHETQFLAGADIETALTLPPRHRTTVFEREVTGGSQVYTWYLRLWDWVGRDLLYGLLRVERHPDRTVLEEVDDISTWILSERAPVAPEREGSDRLLYPIHAVRTYLHAVAGSWR